MCVTFVTCEVRVCGLTAVQNQVTTALADTTKASAALGVTVTEVPTITVRLAFPLPPRPCSHLV